MTARNRNELWARVLVDELARAGVRHLVLAPGSRSGPVALAAAADGRLRIHVQIDERSAAFVALGVGKAGGSPAAILTTSGTAVANLLPAVVEAAQSETPLLVLTADRPPRLRGADANQTIDQTKLFGGYVRRFEELSPAESGEGTFRYLRSAVCRAMAAAIGDPGGPVHLNLAFDKPLEPELGKDPRLAAADPGAADPGFPAPAPGSPAAEAKAVAREGRPEGAPWTAVHLRRSAPTTESLLAVRKALRFARRPVLVGGVVSRPEEVGEALRRAAHRLRIPLLADPLSGARYPVGVWDEDLAIGGYGIALLSPEVRERLKPDLVLRVGAAPTSAALEDWLVSLEGVPHILVDGGGGRWKDHAGLATVVISADPALFMDALVASDTGARGDKPASKGASGDASEALSEELLSELSEESRQGGWLEGWLETWRRMEAAVREAVDEACAHSASGEPAGLEGAVVARVVEGLGADRPLFISSSMPVRDLECFVPHRSHPLRVLGNRGASGIDGIVSTAAGVSLVTGRHVVALMGDLALLHDSNGLSSLRDPAVRVTIVVIHNDGGGIFHLLPIRDYEPAFTPYFATPHGRDFAHLAAFHDLPHRRVEGRGEGWTDAHAEDARRGEGAPHWGEDCLGRSLEYILGLDTSAILEIRTDREENRHRRTEVVRRIAAAAADAVHTSRDQAEEDR